jgi:fumarylpyruvate hydrolase
MSGYMFDIGPTPSVAVRGETSRYPLLRIFCVGRNYEAHAAEMGLAVDREVPFYFTKNPQHFLPSGSILPYPPGTENFHYEMELALAIGKPVFRCSAEEGMKAILAYGCALDMTRRDLQIRERKKERPWDLGKDVEGSAVLAEFTKAEEFGQPGDQRIHLSVNGEVRQDAHLRDMIHGCGEIVADLSRYYHLRPGDIIMTGTPAGVGPVVPGDRLAGGIDGLAGIEVEIGETD